MKYNAKKVAHTHTKRCILYCDDNGQMIIFALGIYRPPLEGGAMQL